MKLKSMLTLAAFAVTGLCAQDAMPGYHRDSNYIKLSGSGAQAVQSQDPGGEQTPWAIGDNQPAAPTNSQNDNVRHRQSNLRAMSPAALITIRCQRKPLLKKLNFISYLRR